jgi:DNA-binding transcriptional MerR regulator
MKRMKRLRSKQKCNSNQLTFYFDTSTITLESYGTEHAQYKTKKVELLEDTEEFNQDEHNQKNCLTQREQMGFKRLNFQERKVIQDLLDHGTEIKDISEILQRSQATVRAEIKKYGGVRSYNAENAQKNSDLTKKEANKYKNSPVQHLRIRVDNLEMQLEIMTETLKEMNRERNKNNF